MIPTPPIETPVLIYDEAGALISSCTLREAFPDANDMDEAAAELRTSGMLVVGGGAAPLITVMLDMWSAFPVGEAH
jgi:hypothetical protein